MGPFLLGVGGRLVAIVAFSAVLWGILDRLTAPSWMWLAMAAHALGNLAAWFVEDVLDYDNSTPWGPLNRRIKRPK